MLSIPELFWEEIPEEDLRFLIDLAPQLDHLGHFPDSAYRRIAKNRHFHLFVPEERGGLNYPLKRGMRIIEEYSRIEGNLGWIVQIGAGGGIFAAYLEKNTSMAFYSKSEQVIAGSDFVGGKAIPVEEGYQVSGEWKYASGSRHATAFTGNFRILSGPEKGHVRAFIVPHSAVQVVENWSGMGMRATDSHEFRVSDHYVPREQTFILEPSHRVITNRLLQCPFLVFARAAFMPVLMGVAYRYIHYYRMAMKRRGMDTYSPPVSAGTELVLQWNQGRTDLYDQIDLIWEEGDTEVSVRFGEFCVRLTTEIGNGIDACHRFTGMEGIRMEAPLNVIYRNYKTAAAHYLLSSGSLKN